MSEFIALVEVLICIFVVRLGSEEELYHISCITVSFFSEWRAQPSLCLISTESG